jgi:hypothetical protein
MSETWDFETRLRQALTPVDPPADLEPRLEMTLGSLVELAAEELEAWELSAMRDPRNWPRQALRPAAAVVVGSAAAVGLVAVRTQRKRHRRRAVSGSMLELAERTLRDVATEARRLADEAPGRH